jgi:hypothetical protein
MPASVPIQFAPPNDTPNLVKLHILEASSSAGPFVNIDSTVEIGTYPDYISEFTTDLATQGNYWFAIQWEDSKGALSPVSEPVQGGTTTLISEIVNRVMLRRPSADELVVSQEAEAAIDDYFHTTNPDPALVPSRVKSGLTYAVLARVQLSDIAAATSSSGASFTAGLVSMKSDSSNTSNLSDVEAMLKLASRYLGMTYARVAQMCIPEIAHGYAKPVMADISRLRIDVE